MIAPPKRLFTGPEKPWPPGSPKDRLAQSYPVARCCLLRSRRPVAAMSRHPSAAEAAQRHLGCHAFAALLAPVLPGPPELRVNLVPLRLILLRLWLADLRFRPRTERRHLLPSSAVQQFASSRSRLPQNPAAAEALRYSKGQPRDSVSFCHKTARYRTSFSL